MNIGLAGSRLPRGYWAKRSSIRDGKGGVGWDGRELGWGRGGLSGEMGLWLGVGVHGCYGCAHRELGRESKKENMIYALGSVIRIELRLEGGNLPWWLGSLIAFSVRGANLWLVGCLFKASSGFPVLSATMSSYGTTVRAEHPSSIFPLLGTFHIDHHPPSRDPPPPLASLRDSLNESVTVASRGTSRLHRHLGRLLRAAFPHAALRDGDCAQERAFAKQAGRGAVYGGFSRPGDGGAGGCDDGGTFCGRGAARTACRQLWCGGDDGAERGVD